MKKGHLTTLSDDRRILVLRSKSGDPADTVFICIADAKAPNGFRYVKFYRYAADTNTPKGRHAAELCENYDYVEPLGYLLPHPNRR